jgi:serine/threonine protein kinase
VGTPDYMPPDGQHGSAPPDTYALGRVLYGLLAGGDLNRNFPICRISCSAGTDAWDLARDGQVCSPAPVRAAGRRIASPMPTGCSPHSRPAPPVVVRIALFDARRGPRVPATPNSADPWAPVLVAALNVLPWLMGFVLLWVLLEKTL